MAGLIVRSRFVVILGLLPMVALADPIVVESRSAVSQPSIGSNYPYQRPVVTTHEKPASTQIRVASASGSSQYDVQTQTFFEVEQLQEELQKLRGQIEELTYTLEQMKRQQKDRYLDLDHRIAELKKTVMGRAGPGDPPGKVGQLTGSQSAIASNANDLGGEQAAYTKATDLVRNRLYPEAIKAFEKIIKETPQSFYVPYAHYWLGEVYMVLSTPNYDEANRHFEMVIQRYPDHSKVPAALFKRGKLLHLKGEAAKAKDSLEALIAQYPKNPSAKLAKEYLNTLH